MRFELTTPTLARLCSTTELRPLKDVCTRPYRQPVREAGYGAEHFANQAGKCGFYAVLFEVGLAKA